MSEERELLRETVAALVDKHASPAAVREAIESEHGYAIRVEVVVRAGRCGRAGGTGGDGRCRG